MGWLLYDNGLRYKRVKKSILVARFSVTLGLTVDQTSKQINTDIIKYLMLYRYVNWLMTLAKKVLDREVSNSHSDV